MRRLVLVAALGLATLGTGAAAQGSAQVTISSSTPGVALSAVDDAADQRGIVLTITSSAPGTDFSAVCTVYDNGGQTTEDHSGRAPTILRFDTQRLHCALSSEGPLRVLAEGPRGNRSLTSTSGGRIVVSLSY